MPSTSERLAKADALLKEASLKVHEFQSTLGPERSSMAQGWLQISKDYRAGLENKGMIGRYQQAQKYLKKARETHKAIVDLTMGR